jgi:hypothetical protein
MFNENELKALQVLLQRVDLKGSEASIVAQIQFKLQRMLEEPKKEADKLDKGIDETNNKVSGQTVEPNSKK